MTLNPYSMLCIFIPLSIAAIHIGDDITKLPEPVYESIFPTNYNELSQEDKNNIINSHNYQACLFTLEKSNTSSVSILAEKIENTCTILTINKD
jgi:hypothetical protein